MFLSRPLCLSLKIHGLTKHEFSYLGDRWHQTGVNKVIVIYVCVFINYSIVSEYCLYCIVLSLTVAKKRKFHLLLKLLQ